MKIKFKTDIETDVAFTIDFLTQRTHEIIKKLKILVKEWISSTNDLKDIVEVQDFMSVLEN